MSADDFPDELFEPMTSAVAQVPASRQLRDAVLSQTTRTIRNRRRLRRVAVAAALVGCYLGGMATMSLLPGADGRGRDAGTVVQKMVRPEDDQVAVDSGRPAVQRITPYERLRRIGDQQLEKYADIPAATRSYRKAIQVASSDQRTIAPDHDTWLLMALKQSTN